MKLVLRKTLDFDEIDCILELKEDLIEKKEMQITILEKKINKMNLNLKEKEKNYNEKIEKLVKKIDEKENNVKKLENIIKTERNERKREQEFMKKKIKKLEKIIKELRVKIQRKEIIAKKVNISMNKEKIQEVHDEINDEINISESFEANTENLKFKEYLINNDKKVNLCFDVFIGLKDKVEYLVYNNKNKNKIEIMRISDKNIIKSLGGHKNPIKLIKYFKKNNNEDYILSCEYKFIIIIWDIQKNFYSKRIEIKNNAYIFDILLFNIFNNNYIVISNIKKDSFSSLYEVKDGKV